MVDSIMEKSRESRGIKKIKSLKLQEYKSGSEMGQQEINHESRREMKGKFVNFEWRKQGHSLTFQQFLS